MQKLTFNSDPSNAWEKPMCFLVAPNLLNKQNILILIFQYVTVLMEIDFLNYYPATRGLSIP